MYTSTAPWQIELCGGLKARQGERLLTRFSTHKTGALFAFLAYYAPQSHPREMLLELFWPDPPPSSARNSLSAALSSLRRQFEPPGTPAGAFVQADRSTVRINPDMIATDVSAFEEAAQSALGVAPGASPSHEALEFAVRLYRGELLPGYYEDWVGAERERLADLYRSLLNCLIQNLADAHAFERALAYAHKAIEADPLREASHRTLMRLHTATGRPMAALEHFRHLERSLKQALDVPPSRATQELVREIAGKLSRPDLMPPIPFSVVATDALPPAVHEKAEIAGSLPLQLTRFFGREGERVRLRELLLAPDVRLVTLTGPGGIGKSRLSLETAVDVRGEFRGRVWFIPLTDVTEGGALRDAIRDGLRLPRAGSDDPQAQIVAALAGMPSLLVLDNCEQLAAAGAPVLRALLEQIPDLTCLLSSRQPLEIVGERVWSVSPLPTPPEGADREAVAAAAGVRLFTDRAQARRADFGITPGNFAAVAALCRALEGIPLALELAADWARMLTPAQMLARLTHRFDLLVSRRPDLPARHRTLHAAISSSVEFLPPHLQQFFARLSVFRGGWTLEAAPVVCGENDGLDACLDDLRRLQERSLILAEEAGDVMRYRMLETLREYAADRLTPEDREHGARSHAEWFTRLAREARGGLTGPTQTAWLERLEAERLNLRAALDWALQNDPVMALQIPEALWRFWEIRGYRPEGERWLEEALRAAADDPREEIAVQRAHTLNVLGQIKVGLGRFGAARAAYEESLAVFRRFDDKHSIASVLNNIGVMALNQDDYAAARPLLEETLALKRELGDEQSLASTLSNLGQVAEGLGELAQAEAYYRQSLTIARKFGLNWGIAHLLANLAELALKEGDAAEAHALYRQSLVLSQELGDKQGAADSLRSLSHLVFLSHGASDSAVRLAAAAHALQAETKYVLRPNVRAEHARQCAEMHAALGAAAYEAQWATGSILPLADAVAEALADPAPI